MDRRFLIASLKWFFPGLSESELSDRADDLPIWCEKQKIQLLTQDGFPPLLRELSDPPKWIFIKGSVACLFDSPWLALIGARKPSAYGLKAAHVFSRMLTEAGLNLVSGLARGIDAVAHSSSLIAGRPTAAVLAHGLDRIYPAEHRGLAGDILESGGCLISEFPPGVTPQPYYFPRRNRLISGLSHGTLVVEAGLKSGSLTTARHAMDQNREVFVVPGPFDEPGFAGSHWLIQQGAKLVGTVEDVLSELRPGILPGFSKPTLEGKADDSSAVSALWEVLKMRGVATLQELVETTGKPPGEVCSALAWACHKGWAVESGPQRYVFAGM